MGCPRINYCTLCYFVRRTGGKRRYVSIDSWEYLITRTKYSRVVMQNKITFL